jgi:hypothetical protein
MSVMGADAIAMDRFLVSVGAPVVEMVPYHFAGSGDTMKPRRTVVDWCFVAGLAPDFHEDHRSGVSLALAANLRRTRWVGQPWDESFTSVAPRVGATLSWWRWLRREAPTSFFTLGIGPAGLMGPVSAWGINADASVGFARAVSTRHPETLWFVRGTLGWTEYAMAPFTEFGAGPTVHFAPEQGGVYLTTGLLFPPK